MLFILLLLGASLTYYIPEYQSNYICYSYGSVIPSTQSVLFSPPFANTPQVILSIQQLDTNGGIGQYSINPSLVTTSTLVITITQQQIYLGFCFRWIAFLDDNVFALVGQITQTIGTTLDIIIPFSNSLSYTPQAAFFLNGVSQSITPTSDKFQYQFSLSSVTQTEVQVTVAILPGYQITQFWYSIIYGSPQYLQTGELVIVTLGTNVLYTSDSRTKQSLVGIAAITGTNHIRIKLTRPNADSVVTNTWPTTIISQITLSYFQYLACPAYCTSCYASPPDCDACIATTSRIGSACTSCQSQMFIQSGQINCQSCQSYCNECSGSPQNCMNCSAATQRINAPSCNTCPLQMFLQSGIDNCQQCASYCNQCNSAAQYCTSCLTITLRSNPPDCISCPAQYYVVENIQVCQQCPLYCNNCQNYTSLCIACGSLSLRINPPDCMDCPLFTQKNGDTCIQCDSTCQTCNTQRCLTCLTQQYINIAGKCVNCPQHCLTCDINICYTCAGNCLQCDFYKCTKCSSDNYYVQGIECIQCPTNCSNCDAQSCYTCLSPRILVNNQCQCQSPCLRCDSSGCLTCISPEYRIQDLNCLFCPANCVACDNSGNCYMEPQNCQVGIYINKQLIQCTLCSSNYFLSDNFCISCSPECSQCHSQPQSCTICRFSNLIDSGCVLCEEQIGLYSNYQKNTCYSMCGDGIVSDYEECDDGNNTPLDGCSNCQIDPGYYCQGITCALIKYPIPQLQQDLTLDQIYNSNKQFQLIYNVPIVPEILKMKIEIPNFQQFQYSLFVINNQQLNISIHLQSQLIDEVIHVIFLNSNEILAEEGFNQQITTISCSISDYIMIDAIDQQTSESTNTMMQYLFLILAIIICLSILFGGLELFWNLLDLFQTILYLKYINTPKPYYLYTFFNLFGFLQFQNLPLDYFVIISNYVGNAINTNQFDQPPPLIKEDGYSSSSILNILPIFNVFLIGTSIYVIAKITLLLLDQIVFSPIPNQLVNNVKLIKCIYRFKYYILKSCDNITKQWIWSGLIRIFISSSYDISFMICLGIYGIPDQITSILLRYDLALTILLTFTYFIVILLISTVAGFKSKTLKLKQNMYGAVFEGLTLQDPFKRQYNTILLVKKFLFMMFLVLLYNEALFQITNIILIQIAQLLYLVILSPLADSKEKVKQIICEFLMIIAELQLCILVIDDHWTLFIYDKRRIFGWICVFSLIMIMITQLCFDVHQQAFRYYQQYPALKRMAQKFKDIFWRKPVNKVRVENMII